MLPFVIGGGIMIALAFLLDQIMGVPKDQLSHLGSYNELPALFKSIGDIAFSFMLPILAGYIAPIFNPLGFGDWRISTALISGFMAKESVVSTLSILYGSTQSLLMSLTTPAALSLLIFCLLYTPCIAAIAAIKRELNGKWALIVVFGQCLIAWLASFVVYHLILLVF